MIELKAAGVPMLPDKWWGIVFKSHNLPSMKKLFSAALSLFTGPLVEGCFSDLSNIVTNKRNRINITTVNALQTIKYNLRAARKSSVDMYYREDTSHDPVNVPHLRKVQSSRAQKRRLRQTA